MSKDYSQEETSTLIDGVKVFDRDPTIEEVKPYLTDKEAFPNCFHNCYAADMGKVCGVNPTPCGYYEGDDMRWEISELSIGTDNVVNVGNFTGLYKTLDEAITAAVAVSEKVYIMRTAV